MSCAGIGPTVSPGRPGHLLPPGGVSPHPVSGPIPGWGDIVTNRNADLVRRAYQAYTQGDVSGLLELVDPDPNRLVLTLGQDRITRMRACRDLAEARAIAGLNPDP